ncbi:hypothetical protein FOCC_FOCC000860 [Frankliniella occidentalis]|nr:hypothetical protein FOCC_FOCC000860 [Frankliniella occidentalis]
MPLRGILATAAPITSNQLSTQISSTTKEIFGAKFQLNLCWRVSSRFVIKLRVLISLQVPCQNQLFPVASCG